MTQVVSFESYKPPARYDDLPFTNVQVEEAATAQGTWALIDTLPLDPVDADPANPASRNLTTTQASDTEGLWYRLIFVDDALDTTTPTDPIQNLPPGGDITNYITADELREQLTLTGATFNDTEIANALAASSGGINAACRRRFWLDPEAVTRSYTPNSPALLEIDDLTRADEITVTLDGEEWVEGSDFLLGPYNAPADGRPYEYLRLLSRLPTLASYEAVLEVTGRFGWLEVPANIHTATAVLAGKLATRLRLAPSGIISFGTAQGVAMRIAQTDPDVTWLLKTYAKQRVQALQLG